MATDFLTTGNDIVSHIAGSRVECFEYDNMAASPPHAASVLFAAVVARGASGLYNLLVYYAAPTNLTKRRRHPNISVSLRNFANLGVD